MGITPDPEGRAQNIIESVGRAGSSSPAAFWAILSLVVTTCVVGYLLLFMMDSSQALYNKATELLHTIVLEQQNQNKQMMETFQEDRPGKMSSEDRAKFLTMFKDLQKTVQDMQKSLSEERRNNARREDLVNRLLRELERREQRKQPQSFWYDNRRWSA